MKRKATQTKRIPGKQERERGRERKRERRKKRKRKNAKPWLPNCRVACNTGYLHISQRPAPVAQQGSLFCAEVAPLGDQLSILLGQQQATGWWLGQLTSLSSVPNAACSIQVDSALPPYPDRPRFSPAFEKKGPSPVFPSGPAPRPAQHSTAQQSTAPPPPPTATPSLSARRHSHVLLRLKNTPCLLWRRAVTGNRPAILSSWRVWAKRNCSRNAEPTPAQKSNVASTAPGRGPSPSPKTLCMCGDHFSKLGNGPSSIVPTTPQIESRPSAFCLSLDSPPPPPSSFFKGFFSVLLNLQIICHSLRGQPCVLPCLDWLQQFLLLPLAWLLPRLGRTVIPFRRVSYPRVNLFFFLFPPPPQPQANSS